MSYQWTVVCGGDNKERDKAIDEAASAKALKRLEDHPCGCCYCFANILLGELYHVRGTYQDVNPYTGITKIKIHPQCE